MGSAAKKLKKAFNIKKMLGMQQAKMPKPVIRDPEKEAETAANKAAEEANLEIAQKKKQRRANSLLSSGGEKGTAKQTLGS